MKKLTILGISALLVLLASSCKQDWEEHYINSQPVSVDMNVWDTLQQISGISTFVDYMKEFEFDTLFQKDGTYTMFIPNNEAFEAFLAEDSVTLSTMRYHISNHFVQSGNISGTEKVQMISEKFVAFEKLNNVILFDGIPIESESPLFLNGKYYILGQVAKPRPSLFEYFEIQNPVLANYIESLDSIELDKELSRPIGFDDNGNTVYDTVLIITNEFEDDYFAVREEFRNKSATVVFPRAEDYNAALDLMASSMGNVYNDHTDIPLEWQNEFLIPYLLEQGVFENSLDHTAFIKTGGPLDTLKLKNILGDSIAIEYQVAERLDCSNGVAYNYQNFSVPDTLFNGSVRFEAEWMTEETGINKYSWDEELVTATSSVPIAPTQSLVPTASNDSIVKVLFSNNFNGSFAIDIKIDNLFPRKYLMVVRTNKTIGGIYNVYLNGNPIKTMDYYDYVDNPYYFPSVTGGWYLPESNGYHYWDAWAINDQPYGDAEIRIEYVEPGEMSVQGLIIDYIDFIPYD